MASWQEFVDTMLIQQGCSGGALIGLDGTMWAQTNMETLFDPYEAEYTAEDGSALKSAAYTDAQRVASFVATGQKLPEGLRISHKKFMILRKLTDDGACGFTVYARCPKGGACITKTASGIVVGTFSEDDGGNAGACNAAVEGLRTYLYSSGI